MNADLVGTVAGRAYDDCLRSPGMAHMENALGASPVDCPCI